MPSKGRQETNELHQVLTKSSRAIPASLHHTAGAWTGLHLELSTRESTSVYMCRQTHMYKSICISLCKCMSVMRKGGSMHACARSAHLSTMSFSYFQSFDQVQHSDAKLHVSLCIQSAVLPWAWCCRACDMGCRLKGVCRSRSRPRRTWWAMSYPSSFWRKQLRCFQYFLFISGPHDDGKQREFRCLFKKRLSRTMRHNKMNWLEKITEHTFLHKSHYIKNM